MYNAGETECSYVSCGIRYCFRVVVVSKFRIKTSSIRWDRNIFENSWWLFEYERCQVVLENHSSKGF